MLTEVMQNRPPVSRRVPLKDITNTIYYVEPAILVSHNSVVTVPTRTSHIIDATYTYTLSPEEIEKIRMKKRKQLKRL